MKIMDHWLGCRWDGNGVFVVPNQARLIYRTVDSTIKWQSKHQVNLCLINLILLANSIHIIYQEEPEKVGLFLGLGREARGVFGDQNQARFIIPNPLLWFNVKQNTSFLGYENKIN